MNYLIWNSIKTKSPLESSQRVPFRYFFQNLIQSTLLHTERSIRLNQINSLFRYEQIVQLTGQISDWRNKKFSSIFNFLVASTRKFLYSCPNQDLVRFNRVDFSARDILRRAINIPFFISHHQSLSKFYFLARQLSATRVRDFVTSSRRHPGDFTVKSSTHSLSSHPSR